MFLLTQIKSFTCQFTPCVFSAVRKIMESCYLLVLASGNNKDEILYKLKVFVKND